ncbi:MAG: phosphogluconate dehydrogenase (NAD(+)-dependent, decarboxylating), partial [Actinomycetota bacterium]
SGSGHFVKMIHNAIEYGMMQSIAEGFSLMKHSSFDLDLKVIAELFNNGSVIESKLVGWLSEAYHQYGQNLKEVTGTVGHSGEVEWAINYAKEGKEYIKVIQESLNFRKNSKKKPSYMGKVLSALRKQFGGHQAIKQGEK